jgi:predicted transcriptional regulator
MAGKPLKQQTLTIDQIAKVLKKNAGLVTPTAKALNVSYQAIQQRIKKSHKLQKIQEDIREDIADLAENALFQNIKDKNMTAIIFYLKTQARHRGYVERQETELSTKDNAPLRIERIIVKRPNSSD